MDAVILNKSNSSRPAFRFFYKAGVRFLSKTLREIEEGAKPPLIIILGAPGSGKSLLAQNMAYGDDSVRYFDSFEYQARPGRPKPSLKEVNLPQSCRVFIVDEVGMLDQEGVGEFYAKCQENQTALVFMAQNMRSFEALDLVIPAEATKLTLNNKRILKKYEGEYFFVSPSLVSRKIIYFLESLARFSGRLVLAK